MRLLKKDEINARVNQVFSSDKWTGVSILLYKDARVDMALLDEEYGQNNWQVEYQMLGTQMFCTISLWDSNKEQWIKKQSNGTESNMEAEKGQASDAFKRAGFMVGIGRELYTAPDILVTLDKSEVRWDDKTKKYKCDVKFTVDDIDYDENRTISHVVLSKEYKGNKEQCFEWPKNYKKPTKTETKTETKPEPTKAKVEVPVEPPKDERPQWQKFYDSLKEKCSDTAMLNSILKRCGANRASEINAFVYGQAEKILKEVLPSGEDAE